MFEHLIMTPPLTEEREATADEWVKAIAPLMPSDFKDWHENNPKEWPLVTAMVIEALRKSEAFWMEQAGRQSAEVIAWATHHDEPMLFPTRGEAMQHCDDDEEPIALVAASSSEGNP